MVRKSEYFVPNEIKFNKSISHTPPKLYPQERDWTCCWACIRSMLSGIEDKINSEDYFIEEYKLEPHGYYSKDIKALGVLSKYDSVYGCDEKDMSFDRLLEYIEQGYYIMVESMYNYSHWFVFLGYYPDENIEKSQMLVYDPYYDNVRLLNVDEFIGMWVDAAVTGAEKDFIGVKRK